MKTIIKRTVAVFMVILMSFSVIAYVGNSDFSVSAASSKTISIKKKPTVRASNIKATSVKLKLSKTKGATQYHIYKSTDKKEWSLVAKTKKTSYTVKNLEDNKTYYFKVRAYESKAQSPYSKVITVTTKKTQETNNNGKLTLPEYVYVSRNYNKQIEISWSKVSGADGFRIYKYDESTGEWIHIKDIKRRHFMFTGLKSGTIYKFAIRPYIERNNEVVFANKQKEITVSTIPEKVRGIKTEFIDKTTLKVSWEKQDSKTVKYAIFFTTGSGEAGNNWDYRLVKTTSKNNYIIKGLNKNSGYVACVVAFNNIDDEKYWGEKTYTTIPKTKTIEYKPEEGKLIEYSLVNGKWKKTVRDAFEENGNIYYYDENGLIYGVKTDAAGYPGFYLNCEQCGKEDCNQGMSSRYCKNCKETIGNGICHPGDHHMN